MFFSSTVVDLTVEVAQKEQNKGSISLAILTYINESSYPQQLKHSTSRCGSWWLNRTLLWSSTTLNSFSIFFSQIHLPTKSRTSFYHNYHGSHNHRSPSNRSLEHYMLCVCLIRITKKKNLKCLLKLKLFFCLYQGWLGTRTAMIIMPHVRFYL